MGSESKATLGAAGRKDLHLFDPNDMLIVDDPGHPLYDARATLPIQEWLVESIMQYGVLEPVIFRKNGNGPRGEPIIEVMDGRQRVRNAREANRRLSANGTPPESLIKIPGIRRQGDDDAMANAILIVTNEHRTPDSPLVRARKMIDRMQRFGATEEDVAKVFRVSVSTVRAYVKLVDLHADVRSAVDQGVIDLKTARALTVLPHAEQKIAVQRILDARAGLMVATADSAEETTVTHVPEAEHTSTADVSKNDTKTGPSKQSKKAAEAAARKQVEKATEKATKDAVKGRSTRQRTVKTAADMKAAREALQGSRSDVSAVADAVLAWALGLEDALSGYPHLANRLKDI